MSAWDPTMLNHRQRALLEAALAKGGKLTGQPASRAPKPADTPLIKQNRSGPNKWERDFALYLQHHLRPIHTVMEQRIGLRLGNGVVYWPDLVTVSPTRGADDHLVEIEVWEVKGFRRPTGIAKVKIAATMNPWATFWLATRRTKSAGGGWQVEKVYP